jgi:hypothetical protein
VASGWLSLKWDRHFSLVAGAGSLSMLQKSAKWAKRAIKSVISRENQASTLADFPFIGQKRPLKSAISWAEGSQAAGRHP